MKTKMVAGLVGTALIAGIFAACIGRNGSATPPPETVPLDAEVLFDGTQFRIRNAEERAWTDITLEIDGPSTGYEYKLAALKPGEIVTVAAMQFLKADGTRFNPFQLKPRNFSLYAVVNATGTRGIWRARWK